jgi:ketosteroid isomerase-like protein
MITQFTDRARRVIGLAREAVAQYHHGYLGTEHLLLGILQEGGGLAMTVLSSAGLSGKQIRHEIERHMPRQTEAPSGGEISFTPMAKQVLASSVDESRRLGHNYIGTEHLLLGLLQAQEGIAARVLHTLGVRRADVHAQIGNQLQAPGQAPAIQLQQLVRVTIATANQQFTAAVSDRNALIVGSLYTFNGQLFPPHSDMVSGRLAIERFWLSAFEAGITGATRTSLEVRWQGDMAYEVGQYTFMGEDDTVRNSGKYMAIWHYERGQWKRHRDIWNTNIPAGSPEH